MQQRRRNSGQGPECSGVGAEGSILGVTPSSPPPPLHVSPPPLVPPLLPVAMTSWSPQSCLRSLTPYHPCPGLLSDGSGSVGGLVKEGGWEPDRDKTQLNFFHSFTLFLFYFLHFLVSFLFRLLFFVTYRKITTELKHFLLLFNHVLHC